MLTTLSVRLDQALKTQSESTLDSLGLSMSAAIRLFLTQIVVQQRLPFAIQLAVDASRMRDSDSSPRATEAMRLVDELLETVDHPEHIESVKQKLSLLQLRLKEQAGIVDSDVRY